MAYSGQTVRLRWRDLYREAELYKAAVRIYTKPLFSWRKALFASTDNRDLYDFARSGLHNLANMHRALAQEAFSFRPAAALHRNFRGKRRDLYIYPWEERLVDLLLYRILSARLHGWFSPNCYAYRLRGFGLDRCQRRIAKLLATTETPLFVVKRDIANYFPSVDHLLLLAQLAELIEPDDYLFRLLEERVRFPLPRGGKDALRGARHRVRNADSVPLCQYVSHPAGPQARCDYMGCATSAMRMICFCFRAIWKP